MDLMKPAADLFCENLRHIMERDGWTMRSLAETAGTSASGISCILSGKDKVTLQRAERISQAVGEPLASMLVERPEKSSKKETVTT